MNDQHPLVSIRCLVYNHEPYLRQCLEGFVMQQTDFPFEAIVHDDASTDNSAAIIREYEEKYPHIIKPIYQTENQYSKRDGSIKRIMNAAMSPYAKYVAYCEGDDYWIDPLKLRKQVDFLESHPDYSMCFHNAHMKYEFSGCEDRQFSTLDDRDYTGTEIYQSWIVPTASVVIRRSVLESELYKRVASCRAFIYGDIVLFLTAAALGKVRAFSDTMSVYRRHAGGVTFRGGAEKGMRFLKHTLAIPSVFGESYLRGSQVVIGRDACALMLSCLFRGRLGYAWRFCWVGMSHAPTVMLRSLFPQLWKMFCRGIAKISKALKGTREM